MALKIRLSRRRKLALTPDYVSDVALRYALMKQSFRQLNSQADNVYPQRVRKMELMTKRLIRGAR